MITFGERLMNKIEILERILTRLDNLREGAPGDLRLVIDQEAHRYSQRLAYERKEQAVQIIEHKLKDLLEALNDNA